MGKSGLLASLKAWYGLSLKDRQKEDEAKLAKLYKEVLNGAEPLMKEATQGIDMEDIAVAEPMEGAYFALSFFSFSSVCNLS